VQALQGRIAELAAHKQEPVLIYCASGNRSTVAAKLLIDAGFEQVINLRRGIAEWNRAGLPVVK
jgi:rhodanese-related sulfurtransferase